MKLVIILLYYHSGNTTINLSKNKTVDNKTGIEIDIEGINLKRAFREIVSASNLQNKRKALSAYRRLSNAAVKQNSDKLRKAIAELKKSNYYCNLAEDCMIFIDRKGKILNKGTNPFSSWLSMSFKDKDLRAAFDVRVQYAGCGSFSLKIHYLSRLVFEAEGGYLASPSDVIVKHHIKGGWQKLIRKFSHDIRKK